MIDIINKKRLGQVLTREDLSKAFGGYVDGKIPDYQMSALLMAICLNGMNEQEIFDLTDLFLRSGDVLTWDILDQIKVDKHSTGGVGDKTTLIVGPVVASCGVPVVKMSGRGLGHTGGTIDKLESIPGFRTDLSEEEMMKQVQEIGLVVNGQTKDLVPMDRMIYALRDVTGTVESIALIASSIMSKKLASGADKIVIDIKVGKGALIKTGKDAEQLSSIMIELGKRYHKEVRTVITNMNHPLGNSIGNSLEVVEAIRILRGEEKNYLYDLCMELSAHMISMGKNISYESALQEAEEAITSLNAYQKFLTFVQRQGGDLSQLEISKEKMDIRSSQFGILKAIDALKIGELSVSLGAGRKEKNDLIDPKVGIVLKKDLGDKVQEGDVLCTLYLNQRSLSLNEEEIASYFTIEP